MDELRLRLDHPGVIDRQRVTGLGGQRQGVPAIVQFYPAIGMVVTVEASAHYHGIEVPAGGRRQRPVQAIAVALEFDLAGAVVLKAFVETVDITLQAAVTDKETQALIQAAGRLRAVQIVADLKAIERAIQSRRDRAGPGLLEIFTIDTAPSGAECTGFREQALIALTVMKGAQGVKRQLRGSGRQHRPSRDFLAIQRDRFGSRNGCGQYRQRRAPGRRRRRYGGSDHRHQDGRLRWIGVGSAHQLRRNDGGAQIPAVFRAGSDTSFEQIVIVSSGRHRAIEGEGVIAAQRAALRLHQLDAVHLGQAA
ncbi:hypothetical protein D3C87_1146800 [compost metagenome]